MFVSSTGGPASCARALLAMKTLAASRSAQPMRAAILSEIDRDNSRVAINNLPSLSRARAALAKRREHRRDEAGAGIRQGKVGRLQHVAQQEEAGDRKAVGQFLRRRSTRAVVG